MTQEDKELLLKDLCTRLPYGVIVDIKYNEEHGSSDRLRICSEGSLTLNTDLIGLYIEKEIYLKPYLRSMSSMTEKEFFEYHNIKYNKVTYRHGYKRIDVGKFSNIGIIPIEDYLDWLNAHHFDYRGLIPMDLALEAPEGMYN